MQSEIHGRIPFSRVISVLITLSLFVVGIFLWSRITRFQAISLLETSGGYVVWCDSVSNAEVAMQDNMSVFFSTLFTNIDEVRIVPSEDQSVRKALQVLPDLGAVRKLSVSDHRITNEDLRYIAVCESLEEVEIVGNQITAQGVAFLEKSTKLKVLTLWCDVQDDLLPVLSKIPSIKTLTLTDCNSSGYVCAIGFQELSKLQGIENLGLNNFHITLDAMETVSKLGSLRNLSIGTLHGNIESLQELKKNKHLASVKIENDYILQSDFEAFVKQMGLQESFITRTHSVRLLIHRFGDAEGLDEIREVARRLDGRYEPKIMDSK